MSSSVWKEQIDEALISFISSTIGKVRDSSGAYNVPVTVIPHFPEKEFSIFDDGNDSITENSMPTISFYIAISRPNYIKQFSARNLPTLGTKDLVKKTVEVLAPTKPFILQYQLDFWTEYQLHMVDMTLKWEGSVDSRFLLPVKNADGESLVTPVSLQGTYAYGTITKKNQRLFRKSYFYNIDAETDEISAVEKPIVIDRAFEINQHEVIFTNE